MLDTSRAIPQVDGLRAVAALGVMAYHQGLLPIGWAGVWVFFVISGFVITRMMIRAGWELSAASYVGFFRRRAGRIWPVYFLYLACASAYALAAGLGVPAPGLLSSLTFTQNLYQPFAPVVDYTYHLWTISGEQQFYLLFPFLFVLANRYGPARVLLGAMAVTVALRAVLFLAVRDAGGAPFAGTVVYSVTPVQFDAFLLGAYLAYVPAWRMSPGEVRRLDLLAAAMLAGVAALAVQQVLARRALGGGGTMDTLRPLFSADPYGAGAAIWAYPVVYVLTACVLAHALSGRGVLARVLGWGPLAWVGLISYGMYLWHRPVNNILFTLTGGEGRGAAMAVVAFLIEVPVVIGIAAASYYGFEKPVRAALQRRQKAEAATA